MSVASNKCEQENLSAWSSRQRDFCTLIFLHKFKALVTVGLWRRNRPADVTALNKLLSVALLWLAASLSFSVVFLLTYTLLILYSAVCD